jgi:uncharacterized protein YegJ (DUF2314 family)
MFGIVWRKIFGVLALLIGSSTLAWFAYNQIYPTPEFQRNYFGLFQLAVPIAFLIVGWRWLRYEGAGIEETPGAFKCPELVDSVVRAKATLPYFIKQVEQNIDGAFVKFPMKTVQGITEHIWAYVHSFRDGRFNVTLANTPKDPKEPQRGRRDVPMEQIEDWQIVQPDSRIKGAYSMIALFQNRQNQGKSLTPKMRKQKAQLIDFPK